MAVKSIDPRNPELLLSGDVGGGASAAGTPGGWVGLRLGYFDFAGTRETEKRRREKTAKSTIRKQESAREKKLGGTKSERSERVGGFNSTGNCVSSEIPKSQQNPPLLLPTWPTVSVATSKVAIWHPHAALTPLSRDPSSMLAVRLDSTDAYYFK